MGQKNSITRRWAGRGTRPRAPHDQRTKWAYIFGAICPKKGKGAALVMPWCDTPAMAAHLAEISAAVDPGAHAVLMLDQAGWHMSAKLAVPDNITLLPLPPRSPELNPVENVWQFMRDNWLSNRVFKSYDDIVALCCDAWNNLTCRASTSMSGTVSQVGRFWSLRWLGQALASSLLLSASFSAGWSPWLSPRLSSDAVGAASTLGEARSAAARRR